jgi:hypothetical protein
MKNAQAKQIMQAHDSCQANIQTCKELFEVSFDFSSLSLCNHGCPHKSKLWNQPP